jgi:hypothetical protein
MEWKFECGYCHLEYTYYRHLAYLMAVWYILWSFVIICCQLVYFVVILYIFVVIWYTYLWSSCIFCGHLVYLWSFGIFWYFQHRFGMFYPDESGSRVFSSFRVTGQTHEISRFWCNWMNLGRRVGSHSTLSWLIAGGSFGKNDRVVRIVAFLQHSWAEVSYLLTSKKHSWSERYD